MQAFSALTKFASNHILTSANYEKQGELSLVVFKWNKVIHIISQLQKKNTTKYLVNPFGLYLIAIEFDHQKRIFMSQMLSPIVHI